MLVKREDKKPPLPSLFPPRLPPEPPTPGLHGCSLWPLLVAWPGSTSDRPLQVGFKANTSQSPGLPPETVSRAGAKPHTPAPRAGRGGHLTAASDQRGLHRGWRRTVLAQVCR